MSTIDKPIDVLVVDDAAFGRMLLQKAFPKDRDINVRSAANGQLGLEQIAEKVPDLIFLDLTMPVMDGFEMLEAVRDQGLDVPVIIVSADVQSGAKKRVMKLGANRVLPKPVMEMQVHRIFDDFC